MTEYSGNRYYCHFENSEVKKGPALLGVSGNGNTYFEAVRDYCLEISKTELVINAFKKDRRIVNVPMLTCKQEDYEG